MSNDDVMITLTLRLQRDGTVTLGTETSNGVQAHETLMMGMMAVVQARYFENKKEPT